MAIVAPLAFAAAGAKAATGFYVAGGLGAGFAGSFNASHDQTRISPDTGFAGVAAVGYRFSQLLRVEAEGRYGSNDLSAIHTRRLDGLLRPLEGAHGNVRNAAVTANLILDAPFHPLGIKPYIGAGVGYARLDMGGAGGLGQTTIDLPENNRYVGPVDVSFEHANAFAYQARAGLAFPLAPHLAFTTEYRFEGMSHADVPIRRTATGGSLVNGVLPTEVAKDGFAPERNVALVGLRLQL